MSEGVWKGVPLKTLLELTGIKTGVAEVLFSGRDSGIKNRQYIPYERSLPIAKALHPEVMIAYEYNGKPLSHKQGFPFRLIVPRWYGMASVKWLNEIILVKDNSPCFLKLVSFPLPSVLLLFFSSLLLELPLFSFLVWYGQ